MRANTTIRVPHKLAFTFSLCPNNSRLTQTAVDVMISLVSHGFSFLVTPLKVIASSHATTKINVRLTITNIGHLQLCF